MGAKRPRKPELRLRYRNVRFGWKADGMERTRKPCVREFMPRFFFDIADGQTIVDDEGSDFATLEAATEHAIVAARGILKHEVWKGRLPLNECIRIRGDRNELIQIEKFRDAVQVID
jgi:hypothetical protein